MAKFCDVGKGLSPSTLPRGQDLRTRRLVEFWNGLRVCEELGGTSWEELEPLERQTADCLSRDPPDFGGADSATAKAFLLIAGEREL